jgi:hypothetical protein
LASDDYNPRGVKSNNGTAPAANGRYAALTKVKVLVLWSDTHRGGAII